jgi:hypothetical protein
MVRDTERHPSGLFSRISKIFPGARGSHPGDPARRVGEHARCPTQGRWLVCRAAFEQFTLICGSMLPTETNGGAYGELGD